MIEIPAQLFAEMYMQLPNPKDCEDGQVMICPHMDEDGNIINIRFIKENDYNWTPFKDIVIKGYLNRIDKVKSRNPILSFFKQNS